MPTDDARRNPPNEKPLKLDMGFEEAVQRFMQSPPMPQDAKRPERKRKGKHGGHG